ncbi:MAG: nucleotidyltransferase domain-containing protein [Candidatus Pacearchaeota archaeon]|nr:nucleotidyltransferase domain-containing protein [Candidatus Pacearchaeota archaeon]
MVADDKSKKKDSKDELDVQQDSDQDTYNKLKDISKEIPEDVKKEIDKLREKLKEFKKVVVKKFPYIEAIGILPPQATQLIEEEEEVQKDKQDEKLVHLMMIVPDDKFKEIPKIKMEAIKIIKDLKPRVWLHVKSAAEIWEMCFDGKYALIESIAMSFPLHDRGMLGALRVTTIHKNLVLRKFEKYVVSYVVAGSLVRGKAIETSDIDIFVVIDDTDVKRMSRFELKEKLRSIIWSYIMEAEELAGVKNKLSPQIYILTEFWESVKDAHPVIFTFIRDGVPLYDRGAFMPWKLLLRMGKIKPSPEAIDMFMSLGEKVAENVRMRLNEILAQDIFWGVVTPSQAVLMLYGMAPPTPKEIQEGEFRRVFVDKEKLLEPKYADMLERIVKAYKKYEHDPKVITSGKEIDEMLADSTEYIKRLKELMKQVEQKMAKKEVAEVYSSVFVLLEKVIGKCTETNACNKLTKDIVEKGLVPHKVVALLQEIIEINRKHKKENITKQEVASMKKASFELTGYLTEYLQRKEILETEKKKIYFIYQSKVKEKMVVKRAELFIFKEAAFLIPDITQDTIKKIVQGKITDSNKEELTEHLKKDAIVEKRLDGKLLENVKKVIGEFEIILS